MATLRIQRNFKRRLWRRIDVSLLIIFIYGYASCCEASSYSAPPSPFSAQDEDKPALDGPSSPASLSRGASSHHENDNIRTNEGVTKSYAKPSAAVTRNTILPFSQYEKRLKQKKEGFSKAWPDNKQAEAQTKPANNDGRDEELSVSKIVDAESADDYLTPRIIYLPSYRNASHRFAAKHVPTAPSLASNSQDDENIHSRSKNPIRAQTNRNLGSVTSTYGKSNADAENTMEHLSGAERSGQKGVIYSTTSSREPLQFQKSVFRSKFPTNENEANTARSSSTAAIGRLASTYGPIASSAESTRSQLNAMFRPSHTLNPHRPGSETNSLHAGRYANLEDRTLNRPSVGLPQDATGVYMPPQTRNIVPAPYSKLSAGASDANLVNSIFSQSQSQVRHAPPTFAAPISPVQSFAPPLSGSPFNLLGAGAANPGMAGANGLNSLLAGITGGGNGAQGGANPLLQLLGQGTTLEQISRIAKNLLSTATSGGAGGGGGGNAELLGALTKAIGAGGAADASKLTSTATSESAATAAAVKNIGDFITDSNATIGENLVFNRSNSTSNASLPSSASVNRTVSNAIEGMAMLNELPAEQRKLLEAAIKNGELDISTLGPSLNALLKIQQNETEASGDEAESGKSVGSVALVHSENKLMEWIQQNRPRPSEKEGLNSFVIQAADRLPYYGRYCGSFVEHQTTPQHYGVAGAVWAADNRRLIVSKFNFRPGSRTENITFWAGPARSTGTAVDVFPSENGFYLKPKPLDVKTFTLQSAEKIPAKVRKEKQVAKLVVAKDAKPSVAMAAEAEAEEEHSADVVKNTNSSETKTSELPLAKKSDINATQIRRAKRNLYDEIYRSPILGKSTTVLYGPHQQYYYTSPPQARTSTTTTAATNSIHFSIQPSSLFAPSSTATTNASTAKEGGLTNLSANIDANSARYNSIVPTSTVALPGATSNAKFVITIPTASAGTVTPGYTQSYNSKEAFGALDWYAGSQPLVLTLPEGKFVNDLHWVSLFDHVVQKAIAYVLIPNGAGFQIPQLVQLRPLSANAGYELRTGPIRVLDTKTIEVSDFYFASRGVPAWFMVGKDILPNSNGQIVPIFNRTTGEFDCDSLRDYDGTKTVTLRLPAQLEIRDVFWFAVFSVERGASLAHIHLPYNEIHAPPDLDGTPTPQCVWKPEH